MDIQVNTAIAVKNIKELRKETDFLVQSLEKAIELEEKLHEIVDLPVGAKMNYITIDEIINSITERLKLTIQTDN